MTLPLFQPPREPYPYRAPAAMLRDRGIRVADAPFAIPQWWARVVAAHVALGGWCDALAWEEIAHADHLKAMAYREESDPELWYET